MKKQNKIIPTLVLLIVLMIGVRWMLSNRVDMSKIDNGSVRFIYGDVNIAENLSGEDFNTIKELFDKKKLYKDNPSCGFNENVAVLFNDSTEIFCIARDTCPIIYYKNKDMYFKLSDDENTLLRSILEKYGFYFPCL